MLLGQILFVLAVLAIAAATAVGIVYGLANIVLYKLSGRSLKPLPEPGSNEWLLTDTLTRVDMARKSLLTEREQRTSRDPVVKLGADRYRVTRLGETAVPGDARCRGPPSRHLRARRQRSLPRGAPSSRRSGERKARPANRGRVELSPSQRGLNVAANS